MSASPAKAPTSLRRWAMSKYTHSPKALARPPLGTMESGIPHAVASEPPKKASDSLKAMPSGTMSQWRSHPKYVSSPAAKRLYLTNPPFYSYL